MITRMELGNMYIEKGGALERRLLGSVLHMTRQILDGGYPTPTPAQTAWARAMESANALVRTACAQAVMIDALVNNNTIQNDPVNCTDGDLDYVVAEFAKHFTE